MRYLLDTNILSALNKLSGSAVRDRASAVGEQAMSTSTIVAAELRFGAARRGSPGLIAEVDGLLSRLDVIPFESPADQRYADLRAELEREGRPIGANDLLIAAHALALGYTLVTDNEREFRRIAGLPVENWLRP
jgi:tRNA(fMet)-specific endonuclease VapC